ncbi:MAG: alpha/beta fold hydrolase [Candidatus Omnitrophica bacterium]|nr:alpha/beta fold hydrolase [Candidatus Omnitrophota bacterium]
MAVLSKKLYPFASHDLELPGGLKYHYLNEGQGEPLVMLHGNPTWSFYYRHLITAFRDRYRVIVPDHIGMGLSDKPQHYPYRLAQHIANLELLIEHLHLKRITLVMHDWGGMIGMGYAVRHPQTVSRFVVFNTTAFVDPSVLPFRLRLCRIPLISEVLIRRFNLFARIALRTACSHQERLTPDVKAGYLAPYDSYANRIATARFVEDIPMPATHPTYPVLHAIDQQLEQFQRHPMLIVWGMQDPVFSPAFLRAWERRFPHAQVKRVEDAGHYVVEDASERIISWMHEFLASHPEG